MEHSKKFQKIKNFYDLGKWTKGMVADAVDKRYITEDEYYEIVGND